MDGLVLWSSPAVQMTDRDRRDICAVSKLVDLSEFAGSWVEVWARDTCASGCLRGGRVLRRNEFLYSKDKVYKRIIQPVWVGCAFVPFMV